MFMKAMLAIVCGFVPLLAFASCEKEIAQANPYKGVVGTIVDVVPRVVQGAVATETMYRFSYRYPNGFEEKSVTFIAKKDGHTIAHGDRLVWTPADEVEWGDADEDRRLPVIINKRCQVFAIDTSIPAKLIPGLNVHADVQGKRVRR